MIEDEKKVFLQKIEQSIDKGNRDFVYLKHQEGTKAYEALKKKYHEKKLGFESFYYKEKIESVEHIFIYFLLLNSINHQFWSKCGDLFYRYENNNLTGATAMVDGFIRWIEQSGGVERFIKTPKKEKDLIFFMGKISDPKKRLEIINQVIKNGMLVASKIKKEINAGFGLLLADYISKNLSLGFEDFFYKKAQLALFMMVKYLKEKYGIIVEYNLTCFPDYQIPKVLEAMGFIEYSYELKEVIESRKIITKNSKEEFLIRAQSVIAIEKISKETSISSPEIDLLLWSMRNEYTKKFHLTETNCY